MITNSPKTSLKLAELKIRSLSTGGLLLENSISFVGAHAENFVRNFNADIFFFSCHGVSEKGILTDPSLPETQIRKVAINQSRKTVFLCDESKFSLSTPYNLVPISTLDYVITNSSRVKEYVKSQDSKNIIIV